MSASYENKSAIKLLHDGLESSVLAPVQALNLNLAELRLAEH